MLSKKKLKSKDAYLLINGSNEINLLLYFKLSHEQMKKALPLSNDGNDGNDGNVHKNYLTAVFDKDGNDYLGKFNEENFLHFINNVEHTTILEKEYTDLPKSFSDKINIEEFYEKKNFCKEQIFFH